MDHWSRSGTIGPQCRLISTPLSRDILCLIKFFENLIAERPPQMSLETVCKCRTHIYSLLKKMNEDDWIVKPINVLLTY